MKAAKRQTKVRQSTAKHGKRGSYVPFEEQLRIIADYAVGGSDNSIRKLADKYQRNEDTISRIVKSPDALKAGQAMLNQLFNKALGKVVERIEYEIEHKSTKDGAWIAMDLAERFGALPVKNKVTPPPPADPVSQEKRVKTWVEKLTEQAMERGKQFGMPMPEMEETETEIRLDGK